MTSLRALAEQIRDRHYECGCDAALGHHCRCDAEWPCADYAAAVAQLAILDNAGTTIRSPFEPDVILRLVPDPGAAPRPTT